MDQERQVVQDGLDVSYRALCLGGLMARSLMELSVRTISDPNMRAFNTDKNARLQQWLEYEGVMPYFSHKEAELLSRPVGSWAQQELIDASWRTEGLGMLLWALRIYSDVPAYDTAFSSEQALNQIKLGLPIEEFLRHCHLRSEHDIYRERALAQLWHWRARTRRVERAGITPPDGWTYESMVAQTAHQAFLKGDIPSPIDGDFPALGRAYTDLSEAEYSRVNSIAVERHYAMNWLCWYTEDWDDVPLDT
ncbi:MAG: DUF4272 domain-containing protein [Chloroflexi bacterium]|nr:DUF4272 domain-containing protein [Chloroflexota bacterium]